MDKRVAVRLLIMAGVFMLLSGAVFALGELWIGAVLVWVGSFGCFVAALNFKNMKDE